MFFNGRLTIDNLQFANGERVQFDWTSTPPIGAITSRAFPATHRTQPYGYPGGSSERRRSPLPNGGPIKALFVCLRVPARHPSLESRREPSPPRRPT